MKGNIYTLSYAAILSTVCALLLAGAASFTGPYQEANKKAEETLNILTALKVPLDEKVSAAELGEIYEANVTEKQQGEITLYIYSPADAGGKTEGVVVRFEGPALWGPVKGFLALESDMRTIRGITFYEQEETPGLGGEIVTDWFRKQFEGKSILDAGGKPGIIIKGKGATAPNQVDAISGATMTCDKVQEMINKTIDAITGAS